MSTVKRTAALALSMSVVLASALTTLAAGPAMADTAHTTSIAITVPGTGIDLTDLIDQNGDVQDQSAGSETGSPEVPLTSTTTANSGDLTAPATVEPTVAPGTTGSGNFLEDGHSGDSLGQSGVQPSDTPSAPTAPEPSAGTSIDGSQGNGEPESDVAPTSQPSAPGVDASTPEGPESHGAGSSGASDFQGRDGGGASSGSHDGSDAQAGSDH